MSMIYVIHENDEWVEPLREAFAAEGLPYAEWFVADGTVPIDGTPPEGVFYNRMSASSHLRGHRYGPEHTAVLLAWLERHRRRVINGSRALQLEVSKTAQYTALAASGIRTPRTVAAIGEGSVVAAAGRLEIEPFIVKPNRGGSGRGVQRFESVEALRAFERDYALEGSVDGVTLVQEYVHAPDQYITRVEFIGGDFFYAVRVDTGGSFELCPADPCALDGKTPGGGGGPHFTILETIDQELISRYRRFLSINRIEIGALEFVRSVDGKVYTYDVNTNTNYNSDAERRAGRYAMRQMARFLGRELEELERAAA